jgi:hypothetical protein
MRDWKHKLLNTVNPALSRFDAEIVRASEITRLRDQYSVLPREPFNRALPEGAVTLLKATNPRLQELRLRYAGLDCPAIRHSVWTQQKIDRGFDLRYFRSGNHYVWQERDINWEMSYLLTAYYVQSIDKLALLRWLQEDDLFGAYTLPFGEGIVLSRDLLESITEIYFLERHLGLTSGRVSTFLDIGAGYGRLAHRITCAISAVRDYACVDAVPESTFLCEYYLSFRDVSRARVIPLFEVEDFLASHRVEVAVNIHSFSWCTFISILWWLDLLRRHRVPYLMIVPNARDNGGTRLLSAELDGNSVDFLPALNDRGYRLLSREPQYLEAGVQKHGLNPTQHWLFELSS